MRRVLLGQVVQQLLTIRQILGIELVPVCLRYGPETEPARIFG